MSYVRFFIYGKPLSCTVFYSMSLIHHVESVHYIFKLIIQINWDLNRLGNCLLHFMLSKVHDIVKEDVSLCV